MIKIIIFSFITNLMFYSYGHFLRYKHFENKIENSSDIGLFEQLHLLAKNTTVVEVWDFAMNAPLEMISFIREK